MNERFCQRKRPSAAWLGIAAAALTLLLASCTAREAARPPAERAPEPVKITAFYPAQAFVAPGDKAQFCYGVESAVSVRLEPPVAELRPLTTKCIWFEPSASMSLSLIATGASGDEVRKSIEISVKAGAPRTPAAITGAGTTGTEGALIETFLATATRIPRGGTTTICYVLRKPATLHFEPPVGELGADLKKCVLARPSSTTRYTLTATAGKERETASVTIEVR